MGALPIAHIAQIGKGIQDWGNFSCSGANMCKENDICSITLPYVCIIYYNII